MGSARRSPSTTAMTAPERSKLRYARPSTSAIATSSPRMFPSLWSERTVTSRGRRSASSFPRRSPRRPRFTPTPRTARRSPGKSEEDLPAHSQDEAQEGQGLLLHPGLQGDPPGNLRPVRDQDAGAGLPDGGEDAMQVHSCHQL